MGIDAEMFARYRGPKPTKHQLKLWSWDLCRAIGAENFFINPIEGRMALDLAPSYDEESWDEVPARAGREWHQDGDTIHAEEGEWFVKVSLCTRYYGEGYERGNWQVICATAEWLEQNLECPVWYGGDSSGVCAELFDEPARRKLREHALSVHGKDYFNGFDRGPYPTPAPCDLCVKERGMTRYGWGQNYVAVACGGCGRSFESRDGGLTWGQKHGDKLVPLPAPATTEEAK